MNRKRPAAHFLVKPGRPFKLADVDTGDAGGCESKRAAAKTVAARPQAAAAVISSGDDAGASRPATDAARLRSVEQLLRDSACEEGHSRQVTRLALQLFDALRDLHGLGADERFLLECAGLLHDIGVPTDPESHHKQAEKMILEASLPFFAEREKRLIACVARYHRRSSPQARHALFATLAARDRSIVRALAAVLRVADGLDRTHADLVRDVTCTVEDERIVVPCRVRQEAPAERQAALKKGDLFEAVFQRQLVIEMHVA